VRGLADTFLRFEPAGVLCAGAIVTGLGNNNSWLSYRQYFLTNNGPPGSPSGGCVSPPYSGSATSFRGSVINLRLDFGFEKCEKLC
jgi:hypothetical protein